MRTPRTRNIIGLLTCIVIAVSGATPSSAAQARVRIGHAPNITHAQALYARAGGQFERKMHARVEWVSVNSGPAIIEAMFASALDVAFVGPNPAINGFVRSHGDAFVIVAGAACGGAGLVVRADAGIESDKDFRNKIIATPQLGNTQDVAARMWFTGHGYRLKEKGGRLSLLPLANPDQLTMFQKKAIDGAWTVEPWLARLELEAGGRLYLDEATLWPNGRYVTTQLIARKAWLASEPELAELLLEAFVEVTQEINTDKAAAARILNLELEKLTGQPLADAVIKRALERVELTWDPAPRSLRTAALNAHEVGFLRQAPDLTGIYALEPLNRVLVAKALPRVSELNP